MTAHVRPFSDEDRAAVVDLWAEAFPDEPAHNVVNDMIDRKLGVQPELFLVAFDGADIVGTVMAGFDGVRGWIHRLAVRSSARRTGVGTMLIQAAEAGLVLVGCPKVNLQVRAENSTVIEFYRAAGYAVEERVSMGKRLELVIGPLEQFREHVDSVTRWLMDEWPDQTLSFEARRARLVAPDDCPPTQLALRGGEPVGVVAFRRFAREPDCAPSLFIDALYTRGPFRNGGVASRLLEAAEGEVRAFARELFVYTDRREWYEKRGWSLLEAKPGAQFVVLRRTL